MVEKVNPEEETMSIFDKIKEAASGVVQGAGNKCETFTFRTLPESLEAMKQLPEASLDTPFKTAALGICAFCAYVAEREIGKGMLDFLKGPEPLNGAQIQFLNDRFCDKIYLPFSYFKGAVPENNYMPDEPFTITVASNPHSFSEEGYARLFVTSGGADSPRPITLRRKGNQWFLWNYSGVLSGIRTPKKDDPWA